MKKNNKWKNLKGILNLQILTIYVIIENVLIKKESELLF